MSLWTQNLAIAESMKKLSEKEKMIINKRFFEGRTQMEVADEIGIIISTSIEARKNSN